MPKNKSIFDDISKMASSTFSTMVNLKNEISDMVRDQIKASLKGMDFVSKSDYEALKKVVNNLDKELKKLQSECAHCMHMMKSCDGESKSKKASKKVVEKKVAAKGSAAKATKKK